MPLLGLQQGKLLHVNGQLGLSQNVDLDMVGMGKVRIQEKTMDGFEEGIHKSHDKCARKHSCCLTHVSLGTSPGWPHTHLGGQYNIKHVIGTH